MLAVEINKTVKSLKYLFVSICIAVSSSCSIVVQESRELGRFDYFKDFAKDVVALRKETKYFEKKGPFGYQYFTDVNISVAQQGDFQADLIKSRVMGAAPLVIFIHGNYSNSKVHAYQAQHLSSWGFHTLSLDLPNKGEWLKNGDRVVAILDQLVENVSSELKVSKILLVGHSFGGSVSMIAASSSPWVSGVILLDPALVSLSVRKHLEDVKVPVILLGADKERYKAVNRDLFYSHTNTKMLELSYVDTTHDEAQFPSLCEMYLLGYKCYSPLNQVHFSTGIIVSAFSISATGSIDYAAKLFNKDVKLGIIKDVKKKYY